jgi:hypothetical protein
LKILKVLSTPRYFLIAVASIVLMTAIYAYSQVLGIVQNLDIWLKVMPWYNAVLFSIFAVLFGAGTAYQVYLWKQPRGCSISARSGSVGANSAGTFAVFLVAQCPACTSIGTLFLPFSAALFIAQFGWLINIVGIAMLLFTINYLGGFKK